MKKEKHGGKDRARERDAEQQMNTESEEHLDRQISCYVRDPPQGTSG